MTPHLIDNSSETPRNEVGGQALLEGVMIRTRTGYAVAARRADGAIVLHQIPYTPLSANRSWLKIPFIRGIVAVLEMLSIGTRALQWSADLFEQRLNQQQASAQDEQLPRRTAEAWARRGFVATAAASLALAAFLMVVLPHSLALAIGQMAIVDQAAQWWGASAFNEAQFPVIFNLLTGLIRALIVVGYIGAIGLNRDIRRVFGYHAAEHQAAWAFEKGDELTVERVITFPRLHPRCGTAFLAIVLLLSIVVFAVATGMMLAGIDQFAGWPWWLRKITLLPIQVALLPVLAAVSFEALKASARHPDHPASRWVLAPGLFLQRLTTRRPDEGQVEVAIVALLAALAISPEIKTSSRYVVQGLHDHGVDSRVRPWSPQPAEEPAT